ncbi:diguanylate cyclase (GGDEF) domain-containing protein [Pseudobutyrivibrio ruminis DSM 9787]|uniref:Diguanylate cyclase (GGDEF) domain-containing protein n=2 Tax=Pseudobutyrivibrio ruminis TaxID=46206 RepID=A0A285T218_9FIRM|nr:diguanylate cyclase (GGDEF) domain-containing protein [Pseudobutyrivibrio ruminis DSM 9787]
MFKFVDLYKRTQHNENAQIRTYFAECIENINKSNLYMMRKICMYTSIIYSLLLILAHFVVPSFKLHGVHFLIIPLMVVYFFINVHLRKPGVHISTHMTGIICGIFYFSLVTIIMLFDAVAVPDRPAVWTPLVIALFPMVYIDKMYKYGIEELIAIIIYAIIAFFNKEPELYTRELYMLVAAYVLSMLSAHIILVMRSREGLAMIELRQLSSLDKLTHVLNKDALMQRMEYQYIQKKPEEACAMLMIDLDNFKDVNDNLGHDAGDRLLERVGQLLIDNFRAYDIIGRYGGDEFVVLMPKMNDTTILEMRCRTLQMFMTDINLGNGQPFTASIGAIIDDGNHTCKEIFRMADDALYKSKLTGKSKCTAWKIDGLDYPIKPVLIALTDRDDGKFLGLTGEDADRYEIVRTHNEDEALRYISQYHEKLELVEVDMSLVDESGIIIKYLKKRESFMKIPILAMASSPEESFQAKELGADEVLLIDATEEIYQQTIKRLIRM